MKFGRGYALCKLLNQNQNQSSLNLILEQNRSIISAKADNQYNDTPVLAQNRKKKTIFAFYIIKTNILQTII